MVDMQAERERAAAISEQSVVEAREELRGLEAALVRSALSLAASEGSSHERVSRAEAAAREAVAKILIEQQAQRHALQLDSRAALWATQDLLSRELMAAETAAAASAASAAGAGSAAAALEGQRRAEAAAAAEREKTLRLHLGEVESELQTVLSSRAAAARERQHREEELLHELREARETIESERARAAAMLAAAQAGASARAMEAERAERAEARLNEQLSFERASHAKTRQAAAIAASAATKEIELLRGAVREKRWQSHGAGRQCDAIDRKLLEVQTSLNEEAAVREELRFSRLLQGK